MLQLTESISQLPLVAGRLKKKEEDLVAISGCDLEVSSSQITNTTSNSDRMCLDTSNNSCSCKDNCSCRGNSSSLDNNSSYMDNNRLYTNCSSWDTRTSMCRYSQVRANRNQVKRYHAVLHQQQQRAVRALAQAIL